MVNDFLKTHHIDPAAVVWLPGDASRRRYARLPDSKLLMVLGEGEKPVSVFKKISDILRRLDLSAPECYTTSAQDHLMLLEDFGHMTYNVAMENGFSETVLYETAIDVLIRLHQTYRPSSQDHLPVFTPGLYAQEVALFWEWYLPAIECAWEPHQQQEFLNAWQPLFDEITAGDSTLVLRDFMVDNLMWLDDRKEYRRCGLLDFQDALLGHSAYDLVSLLEDARRDVPGEITTLMLTRYQAAFPEKDWETFLKHYHILGAQRSFRILGVFARLARRDGKNRYLDFIPRVWRWIEQDLQHPALRPIKDYLDEALPARKRIVPDTKPPL